MEADSLRSFLLQFPQVTEETPFGEGVVVYKTAGKMFALLSWEDQPLRLNLKCDPAEAEKLRDQHACVLPGYHMNKKHWNTVLIDNSVEDPLLMSWIEHSFDCVLGTMSRQKRDALRAEWQETRSLKLKTSPIQQEENQSFRRDLKNRI